MTNNIYTFENYDGRTETLSLNDMSIKHNIPLKKLLLLESNIKTVADKWYILGAIKPLYTLTNTKTGEVKYNLTTFKLSKTKTLSRCQISKLLNGQVKTAKKYTLTTQTNYIS